MSTIPAQIWKSSSFTVERTADEDGTTFFRFSGRFTMRDMYSSLSPDAFRSILEPAPGSEPSAAHIFDLTGVPYMDSHGLGVIVRHYVRCERDGIRLSITGASPRVQELFRLTRMDHVLPIANR
jgi:anti-anti-sigma factor